MRLPDPLVVTPTPQREHVDSWGVQRNFEAITQRFPLGPDDLHFGGTVTALPTGVDEGFEVNYIADSTNGVVWRFKYLPTTSATYPWLFIGGPPLYDDGTGGTITSTTYQTSNAATVTLPALAGNYDVWHGGWVQNNAAGLNEGDIRVHDDGNAVGRIARHVDSTTYHASDPTMWNRLTAVGASSVLDTRYKTTNEISMVFSDLWIAVRPIRVA